MLCISSNLLAVLHFVFLLGKFSVLCCDEFKLTTQKHGVLQFIQISALLSADGAPIGLEDDSGRPSYISTDNLYLLYHTHFRSSVGKWILERRLNGDAALNSASEKIIERYIESWALTPDNIQHTNTNAGTGWMTQLSTNLWERDPSVKIECFSYDIPIYFESSNYSAADHLNGFYVKRIFSSHPEVSTVELNTRSDSLNHLVYVYMKVKELPGDAVLLMHEFQDRWLIGHQLNTTAGIAYMVTADHKSRNIQELRNCTWHILHTVEPSSPDKEAEEWDWFPSPASIVYPSSREQTMYEALYAHRELNLPMNNVDVPLLELHNGLLMPSIGLGTGGLRSSDVEPTVLAAYSAGYQMLDLAREYGNEHIIGSIIESPQNSITKKDLFLVSKVWPTQLGFYPTMRAVQASLLELRVAYIDLYLLHWPKCYSEIEWMHCETKEDDKGTWVESWHALEKYFAEGRLNSIGVSNFNANALHLVSETVGVLPHVVQNYASIGILDVDVQQWCYNNHAIFQPYSSMRNMDKLSPQHKHELELGNSIIPRSRKIEHLQENIDILHFELNDREMDRLRELDPEILRRMRDEM